MEVKGNKDGLVKSFLKDPEELTYQKEEANSNGVRSEATKQA
jgi:hypothetical protein